MTTFSASSLRLARFVIPGVCLATALGTSALGQTFNVASGDWNTAGSWNPATVPSSGTATFSSGSSQTATVGASTSVARISVSSASKTFQGLSGVQTLTVNGALSSSLSTTLNLDSINLAKTGTSSLTLNAGSSFNLSNGGQYSHSEGQLLFSGAGTSSSFTGTGVANFSRNAAPSSAIVNFSAANGQTLSFGSGITSTFTSGAIAVNGTSSTLANAGTMNLAGSTFSGLALTFNNTGTLNVGAIDTSLPSTSALNLTGGTFSLNITDAVTGGSLSTLGAITLSGSPALSVTSVSVPNTTVFTILSGGSLSGVFAGGSTITAIGGQQYTVGYTGTSVTLTAVPEPQQYAAAVGLGLVAFTAWRRNRKTA